MFTSTGSWDISRVFRKSLRLKTNRLSPLPKVALFPRRSVENVDCAVFNLHCFLKEVKYNSTSYQCKIKYNVN